MLIFNNAVNYVNMQPVPSQNQDGNPHYHEVPTLLSEVCEKQLKHLIILIVAIYDNVYVFCMDAQPLSGCVI